MDLRFTETFLFVGNDQLSGVCPAPTNSNSCDIPLNNGPSFGNEMVTVLVINYWKIWILTPIHGVLNDEYGCHKIILIQVRRP